VLLAVDIGNSFITIGLFSDAILRGRLKIPVRPRRPYRAYESEIKEFLLPFRQSPRRPKPLAGVALSSVVPELSGLISKAVANLSNSDPLMITASMNTGLRFDLSKPFDVGTDRIANAVAAYNLLGSPVIAVDFGSATTLSAVKDDTFIGGSILPGISLMAEALHGGTALLPPLDISPDRISGERRPSAVGKDTPSCMVSGIIYGTAGAVERLVTEMEHEASCNFKVVITGGNAGIMARFLRRGFRMEPDLTLSGLRLIYERNT